MYIYIYIYIHIYVPSLPGKECRSSDGAGPKGVSLYTILSVPIVYGVLHIKGRSGGDHIWR